jgi:hypothetical protein
MMPREASASERQVARLPSLKTATVAFMIALAVHGIDHTIRGTDVIQPAVQWGGTIQVILAVVVLALVLREHPSAATAAAVLGFGSAILFTQTHLLPHWGPTSDSYLNPETGSGVTAFSWVTAVLEVGAGLILGAVAVRAIARGNVRQIQA